jgi:mannan endo-1,4-beta-mannosidase
LLGFDLYDRGSDFLPTLESCAQMVSSLAKERRKIAAVTESGGPIDKNHEWWTQVLETVRPFDLAYLLVWRNPHQPAGHGAFAPYKGSPDSKNFMIFYNSSKTLFQKDVTQLNLYN